MDTILGIPCAHTAKAIAAVVQRFQYLGNLSGGFLLFKGCNHTLPLTVCIAAQTQHLKLLPKKGWGVTIIKPSYDEVLNLKDNYTLFRFYKEIYADAFTRLTCSEKLQIQQFLSS